MHTRLARAERDVDDGRARALGREWWCAMHAAVDPHAAPLHELRDQLETALHQLQRLSARLLEPDAHRPPPSSVDDAAYASALYGQMPRPGEVWSETLGE